MITKRCVFQQVYNWRLWGSNLISLSYPSLPRVSATNSRYVYINSKQLWNQEKKFQCLSEISKLEHSTKKILEPRGRLFCWTYIRSFFLFRIHIPSHSLGGVCLSLWQMHTIHKPHDNLDFNIRRGPYS